MTSKSKGEHRRVNTNIGPTLETPRLLLRLPELGDFERYADMFADESTHHIGGPLSRHDAWRRFLQMPGAWMVQGFAMFSVVEKASGLWMGQAGPWFPDGWIGTEVGYSFHPDARGAQVRELPPMSMDELRERLSAGLPDAEAALPLLDAAEAEEHNDRIDEG